MSTYPKYRLAPEIHAIHAYAPYEALLDLQFRLSAGVRLLIETDLPPDSGLEALEAVELLEALAKPLTQVDDPDDRAALLERVPLALVSIDAIELASSYLEIIAANIRAGVYALPEGIVQRGEVSEYADRFADHAEQAKELASRLRAMPRPTARKRGIFGRRRR